MTFRLSKQNSRSALSLALHVVTLCWFSYVWLWHWTDAASKLPGAHGFGRFFRYLTYNSFTLQILQLALSSIDEATRRGRRTRLSNAVDILSCALFGLAHVVTIMFHVIQAATKSAVEDRHLARPPWLDFTVHKMNVIYAWADLLVASPRTFGTWSEALSSLFVISYTGWILICRQVNGKFPYPFMNNMPLPSGFLILVLSGVLVFALLFRIGKMINYQLQRLTTASAAYGKGD